VRVQVCVFAFDLLFLNGLSYVKEPLSSRRARLYSLFGPLLERGLGGREGGFEGRFAFAAHTETNDPEKVQEFFTEALEAGCEGIMVRSEGVRDGGEEGRRE
jgi:DNA ligase-1